MVNISVLNRKQIFRFTFLLVLLFLGILVYFYRVPIGTFLKERLTFLEIRTTQRVVNEEDAVIEVVDDASPAVVSVVQRKFVLDFFSGPLSQKQGIGTGFIIKENGVILTNRHVVSDQDAEYSVVTADGTEYEVKEIHRDPAYDLAILKISASGLPVLSLGDSDKIRIGQSVVAIGNALGKLSNTVTKGIISGIGRGITAGSGLGGDTEELDDVIQTDAAINPGNSGGPLLNLSSEVVGINVAVASGAENIGFAIPINLVKSAVEQFEKTGTIVRPFLGVSYYLITEDAAKVQDLPQGAFVQGVTAGSAAAKAGVKVGDVITTIEGESITEKSSLAKIILKYEVGDKVVLAVVRNGRTITLSATLGKSKAD